MPFSPRTPVRGPSSYRTRHRSLTRRLANVCFRAGFPRDTVLHMRHDPTYKDIFAHPFMVEELMRWFVADLCNGRELVDALDFDTLARAPEQSVSGSAGQLRTGSSDMVWRVRFRDQPDGDAWLLGDPDARIPVQRGLPDAPCASVNTSTIITWRCGRDGGSRRHRARTALRSARRPAPPT